MKKTNNITIEDKELIEILQKGKHQDATFVEMQMAEVAAKKLVEKHKPLVEEIVIRFLHVISRKGKGEIHPTSKKHLIAAGMHGIRKALSHYDSNKAHKFSIYISWWIREEIFKQYA